MYVGFKGGNILAPILPSTRKRSDEHLLSYVGNDLQLYCLTRSRFTLSLVRTESVKHSKAPLLKIWPLTSNKIFSPRNFVTLVHWIKKPSKFHFWSINLTFNAGIFCAQNLIEPLNLEGIIFGQVGSTSFTFYHKLIKRRERYLYRLYQCF